MLWEYKRGCCAHAKSRTITASSLLLPTLSVSALNRMGTLPASFDLNLLSLASTTRARNSSCKHFEDEIDCPLLKASSLRTPLPARCQETATKTATADPTERAVESPERIARALENIAAQYLDGPRYARVHSPIASQQQWMPALPPPWHIWYALDKTKAVEVAQVGRQTSYVATIKSRS